MKIFSFFKYIIYINLLKTVLLSRYPINHDLDNSTGAQDLIEIETRVSLVNYTKYNKAITIFHANICRYCYYLVEVFKWASSYSKVSDWKFLSVNCTHKQLICKYSNITKFPTIKTHIYNRTELPYEAPYELFPLLEYLIKLSTPSLIEITEENNTINTEFNKSNITEFYKNFGYFSPIVEYNTNDLYNCIINLVKDKYRIYFYFGMKKIQNNETEKIIIDNDGAPFTFIWDKNCSNVGLFLNEHLYPLVTIIDNNVFFYNMNKRKKLIVMLFGFLINNKTKNFINNEYKYLAYKNKKLIFCFLNYTNTSEINRYFGVKLYTYSELKLIIFDFSKSKYYIHPTIYDFDYNRPEEIFGDFDKVLSNLSDIQFTTGYLFKDIMIKLGYNEFTTSFCICLVLIIIITLSISLGCTLLCQKVCQPEIEENEKIEENNDSNKNNSNNDNNSNNNNKNDKLKKE